jgi:hypothetical protein
MKIMTRAEAKAASESKYYTGELCKHGHRSYRYTQSGSCAECIRGAGPAPLTVERLEEREKLARIRETLATFVEIKIRCLMQDHSTVRTVVHGFAMQHNTDLQPGHVWNPTPKHGIIYRVMCHPEDVIAIRKYSDDLCNEHDVFDYGMIARRLKGYDPPPLPPVTIDDIAK